MVCLCFTNRLRESKIDEVEWYSRNIEGCDKDLQLLNDRLTDLEKNWDELLKTMSGLLPTHNFL